MGKEIGEHAKHAGSHSTRITVVEAIVLSAVAIITAWSGYSAAKWATDSSLELAKASAMHTKASRAYEESLIIRAGDATTFNAWFGAYVTGRKQAIAVAERRFRPQFKVAFDAWLKTDPFTNRHAPPGPEAMPEYHPTGEAESVRLDASADHEYKVGEHSAGVGDDYVRTTVILASVLFLIGISSHFPVRAARIALISVGVGLLVFAVVLVALLPRPPLN